MKRVAWLILACTVVLGILLNFFSPRLHTPKGVTLDYFRHESNNYSYMHIYEIKRNATNVILEITHAANGSEVLHKKGIINAEVLDELLIIVNQYNILSWDGYDESNMDILDGNSINLDLHFSDGSTVKMYGYATYPAGFDEADIAMMNILKPVIAQYLPTSTQ